MPDTLTRAARTEALAAVWAHLEGPPPPRAKRHTALADIAHRGAEGGLDDDAVLHQLDRACSQWAFLQSTVVRWATLLRLLREARETHPADDGGWPESEARCG